MFYLFYGKNTYKIKEKTGQLGQRFIAEYGDTDMVKLEGSDLDQEKYSNAVFALPFFSSKRLVIIKNFLLENKNEHLKKFVRQSIDKIPSSTSLVFVEMGEPDHKSQIFKVLNQPKTAFKFDLLNESKLIFWIIDLVKKEGGDISNQTAKRLQLSLENDIYRLENEIKKLVLYQKSQNHDQITINDIEKLVQPVLAPDIFEFISALSTNNPQKSLKILHRLQLSGEADLKILAMMAYQFRTMLMVFDMLNKKITPSKIGLETNLRPFIVSKTISLLKKYNYKRIVNSFTLITGTDVDIKSGKTESNLALALLVAKIHQQFCAPASMVVK